MTVFNTIYYLCGLLKSVYDLSISCRFYQDGFWELSHVFVINMKSYLYAILLGVF